MDFSLGFSGYGRTWLDEYLTSQFYHGSLSKQSILDPQVEHFIRYARQNCSYTNGNAQSDVQWNLAIMGAVWWSWVVMPLKLIRLLIDLQQMGIEPKGLSLIQGVLYFEVPLYLNV